MEDRGIVLGAEDVGFGVGGEREGLEDQARVLKASDGEAEGGFGSRGIAGWHCEVSYKSLGWILVATIANLWAVNSQQNHQFAFQKQRD